MTTTRQRELERLLKRKPDGKQNDVVLVVGAGIHKYLAGRNGATPGCGLSSPLADWSSLVDAVAKVERLYHARHYDPAADWESLVCELATRESIQAATAETRLLRIVKSLLNRCYYSEEILRPVGVALIERYQHIISLNVDSTLTAAIKFAGAQTTRNGQLAENGGKSWVDLHETLKNTCGGVISVWYPHGCVESSHEFILGTRQYGNVISELNHAFGNYKEKKEQKQLRAREVHTEESWRETHRRTITNFTHLNWVRLMMVCDLVFIGVGLDRAETDLWWALHQRQRNLARVPAKVRPRTFMITSRETLKNAQHLHTEPAGVLPVCYAKWDEAWSVILG